METTLRRTPSLILFGVVACSGGNGGQDSFGTGSSATATDSTGSSSSGTNAVTSNTSGSTTTGSSSSGGPIFDVGGATSGATTGPVACDVLDPMEGVGPCGNKAPPNSFVPEVQWSFDGMPGEPDSIVTPLVANMTDDNDDGTIDMCDTPDILVVGSPDWYMHGHMVLLDGATGAVHFQFAELSQWAVTPAIGDIDGDGLPEVVGSITDGTTNVLSAWDHDGTLKWSTVPIGGEWAIALADMDNDADVEIIVGNRIIDHDGVVVATAGDLLQWPATTAADLDGDGDLELVMGRSAWHHDGTELFFQMDVDDGIPHVADLDQDGLPEVLLLTGNFSGISMIEHDGSIKYENLMPTGDTDWRRPAAVHDGDGDGVAEFFVSSESHYAMYEGDATLVWSAPVVDASGLASGTAFDFLGDGVAEAIYGDEFNLFAFRGEDGTEVLKVPRSSGTLIEYPVVADVDNDGSAEIVVVSNEAFGSQSPMVQVIRDVEDRWIQARRIWNQHTYHVTNVHEDGTIPQFEPPHWLELNTFRTQAQIEGGVVCKPEG